MRATGNYVKTELSAKDLAGLSKKARKLRMEILTMLTHAGSGHTGGSLSAADILTVLYFHTLRHLFSRRAMQLRFSMQLLRCPDILTGRSSRHCARLGARCRGIPVPASCLVSKYQPAPWGKASRSPMAWQWGSKWTGCLHGFTASLAMAKSRKDRSGKLP